VLLTYQGTNFDRKTAFLFGGLFFCICLEMLQYQAFRAFLVFGDLTYEGQKAMYFRCAFARGHSILEIGTPFSVGRGYEKKALKSMEQFSGSPAACDGRFLALSVLLADNLNASLQVVYHNHSNGKENYHAKEIKKVFHHLGFAVLGLCQLVKRKSIRKVDFRILLLGAFYMIVIALYLFSEFVVIHYRPVMLSQSLETAYPTLML
jgi:hypothetical protein